MKSINRNIYMLYLIKVAKWFMLVMPIIVLFYQSHGLSLRDVLTVQAVYSVSIVLWEIPSGYAADYWGRRKTIILGSILGTIGFVIYSFANGFWGFIAAESVLGIGISLISGADSAILYDSLVEKGRQNEYMKLEGRVISIGNFSETLAALAGGLLAEISLRTPFIAQTFVAFIAVPASFLLYEPARTKPIIQAGMRHILSIVRHSLFVDKDLRRNIMYSAIIGSATLSMAWFLQPYLQAELKMSAAHIGITWFIMNLAVGLATLIAYKVEKVAGARNTLILIALAIPGGYILMAYIHSWIVLGVVLLFYIVRGIATPVLKDYINRITTSDIRATVLSVRNFLIRILFSIIGPFVGYFADVYSLRQALYLAGTLFFIFSAITLLFFLKSLPRNNIITKVNSDGF
ncbi:MAG: MFS transporter [Bacteroidales bacterium]|nr:MFS transporter [Bacteroidales bacterium]